MRDLTLALYETTPRDTAAVQHWLEEGGFDFDRYGYYERIDLLTRARAGQPAGSCVVPIVRRRNCLLPKAAG